MTALRYLGIAAILGLVITAIPLIVAILFAARPSASRLELMRPVSLAAIFSTARRAVPRHRQQPRRHHQARRRPQPHQVRGAGLRRVGDPGVRVLLAADGSMAGGRDRDAPAGIERATIRAARRSHDHACAGSDWGPARYARAVQRRGLGQAERGNSGSHLTASADPRRREHPASSEDQERQSSIPGSRAVCRRAGRGDHRSHDRRRGRCHQCSRPALDSVARPGGTRCGPSVAIRTDAAQRRSGPDHHDGDGAVFPADRRGASPVQRSNPH